VPAHGRRIVAEVIGEDRKRQLRRAGAAIAHSKPFGLWLKRSSRSSSGRVISDSRSRTSTALLKRPRLPE
jgi:hypothetical protein